MNKSNEKLVNVFCKQDKENENIWHLYAKTETCKKHLLGSYYYECWAKEALSELKKLIEDKDGSPTLSETKVIIEVYLSSYKYLIDNMQYL